MLNIIESQICVNNFTALPKAESKKSSGKAPSKNISTSSACIDIIKLTSNYKDKDEKDKEEIVNFFVEEYRKSDNFFDRINMINVIGKTRTKEAAIALENMARLSNDYSEHEAIIKSLGDTRNEHAINVLDCFYRTYWTDNEMKTNIINAMGQTRSKKAIEMLYKYYNNNIANQDLKELSVTSLGNIKSSEAATILHQIYEANIDSITFRCMCIKSIGETQSVEAVEILKKIFKVERRIPGMKKIIIQALGKTGNNDALAYLKDLYVNSINPEEKTEIITAISNAYTLGD